MENSLPDLLRDYKLETRFHKRHIIHIFDDPDAPPSSQQRLEYWENEKRPIGRGGQGRVFLQTCTSGSRSYTQRAVKMIPFHYDGGRRRYIRELETIIKFSHDKYSKYFAKTLGWYESRDSLYIAMEYFPAGDLYSYLGEHPPFPEDDCRQITSQVLRGLAVMHGEGFAHRDIKPQVRAVQEISSFVQCSFERWADIWRKNVLIQQCPTAVQPGSWWVKLADFGISKRLGAATSGSSTLIGTEEYMAPELFDRTGLSDINYQATDMWALGVMTFFLLTKCRLFQSRRFAFQYEMSPERYFPSGSLDDCHVTLDGQAFIRALMRPRQEERLGSDAAMRHAWVYAWMPRVPMLPDANSESSMSSSRRSSFDEERGMRTEIESSRTQGGLHLASAIWTDEGLSNCKSTSRTKVQDHRSPAQNHMQTITQQKAATCSETAVGPVYPRELHGQVRKKNDVRTLHTTAKTEVVKLVPRNKDITNSRQNRETPMYAAARGGYVEVVKLLLENRADISTPNSDGCTPVYGAASNGHVEVVKLLLENGADSSIPKNNGWTPINAAADNEHVEVVKLLLEKGADITIPSNDGRTPVYIAASNGHVDVVKLLLENGADITVPNENGWTPVNSAACNGQVEPVKLLLEKGADITIPSNDGWTPVYAAACNGHVDVVKLLLENGADITVPNENGWTPVNSAACNGQVEPVKLLLENEADITNSNTLSP
ncbi:Ankyrin repeat [Fusarium oxysporum f. sp. vasinfectum]|nr:Ankyrin repeat [Fusarium oxysporum f. sp. vasinfectum]